MVAETNIRKGFMTDAQYDKLRDELPSELKALFVTAYITGLRRGEITAIQWPQIDFEAGLITLEKGETKTGEPRSVPDSRRRHARSADGREGGPRREVATFALGIQPQRRAHPRFSVGMG